MPTLEQDPETINVVLLGSDQEAIDSVGRTDVIIIVSVNPDIPSVSLLSVPRDFYAWIPNEGFNKINVAFSHGERNRYPGGGAGMIKAVIEYNLGIPIHYYARVGFDGFVKIVDALGGVDVPVECALSDTFPDEESPTGSTDVDWLPGVHHLDGKHALWYARSRWSTHDFDRNRRQQQVIRGLYHQAMTLDVIPKLPELWGTLKETVATDLGLDEMLYLANVGRNLDMTSVQSSFVGGDVLQSWTAPNGGYVLVPYRDAIPGLVADAMAPPAMARAQQQAFRVEVWNATGNEGLGHVAAARLGWEGFEVAAVKGAPPNYPRTQIVDFTTTSKGSPLWRLRRIYRLTLDDVVAQPTDEEERPADFRVILGGDYDPCFATKIRWHYDDLPTPTPLPPATPLVTPTSPGS